MLGMKASTSLLALSLLANNASAADAGLTVLRHELDVSVDARGALTRIERWKVRVDDPGVCGRKQAAPAGLEGASAGGGKIVGGLLTCEGSPAAGAEMAFEAKTVNARGPFGESWTAVPGLKTEEAVVSIKAPVTSAIGAWADRPGSRTYTSKGAVGVNWTWSGRPAELPARVIWGSFKDWGDAGAPAKKALEAQLKDISPAKALAEGDTSVAAVTGRVIAARPSSGEIGTYATARPLAAMLEGEPLTLAERALLLTAALRAAGHDAHPALYEAHADDLAPIVIPSPGRFDRPAVSVRSDGPTVWLDPAATYAAVPELPMSMAGRFVWRVGEHPERLPGFAIDLGEVSVLGEVKLGATGSTFEVTLAGSGVTPELLRGLLAPVSADARGGTIASWSAGRMSEVQLAETALTTVGTGLQLKVSGKLAQPLTAVGTGTRGELLPLLAPGLSAVLPSGVRVREDIRYVAPEGGSFVANAPFGSEVTADAIVYRQVFASKEGLTLRTQIERRGLERALTPELQAFLDAQAKVGISVLAFPSLDKKSVASAKKLEGASGLDITHLQASMLFQLGEAAKAEKLMAKAAKMGTVQQRVDSLASNSLEGQAAPWRAMYKAAATDEERFVILGAMRHKGLRRDAWQFATALAGSQDGPTKLKAYLLVLELQGEQPDPAVDLEASKAWIPPKKLIKAAYKLGSELSLQDPHLIALTVEDALVRGRVVEARELLEKAVENGLTSGVVKVLLADADAVDGAVVRKVMRTVREGIDESPNDPEVWRNAARTAARVGERDLAIEYAVMAARVSFDDPHLWLDVVDYAIAAGDLPTALSAAQHASDTNPDHRLAGIRLKLTAAHAGRLDLSNIGAERGRQAKESELPPFDVLLDQAGDDARLAMLRHHDGAVVKDAKLLRLRAELLLKGRHLDEASRDGQLLFDLHRDFAGDAIAFAARAGSAWSPNVGKDLDVAAAKDPLAKAIRMEYGLLSGLRDPYADAGALSKTDPRAQALVTSKSNPDGVAKMVPGWEPAADQKLKPPPTNGWKLNGPQDRPAGVVAFSEPVGGVAIQYLTPNLGLLPGPTGVVFRQPERPLYALSSGVSVYSAKDCWIPVYLALLFREDGDIVGLGLSPDEAQWAVEQAASIFAEEE